MASRLKEKYRAEIRDRLREQFDIQNPMRIPTLEKIVVNMGVGEAAQDSRRLDGALDDLARITGQKAQVRRARKSIAGFKIREGMPVGARVTLRGERMWEFLDRLVTVALPRVRDFRGISPRAFDGKGNYALGLREQIIFPEISYDAIDATRGLDVAIVTTAETDDEARELLRMLGMPFREN
ncbi:Ribosomal protein L5 [Rubrobacter radiotolerans]|uniref:Large ribosomal subunit protein uL5 n=1 Tax=Rubrobacter radiotolerans TaxID=42256 RepID=A0A023X565_RUBRA|nr:50S ribosomal protein L5 [Rubrobacter radiotolerans]AHY47214.1 Ribosomal protein L5 [Rubrobacter radiotolerans]MDX5894617.1 50S ribosomal protein L5 [Rubrobacter radiotolerans]SMC06400.1 LSU ribosomal protein L5P [Rubrobacter radiotolerans DSM 5868]